jgi:hypothetical protein
MCDTVTILSFCRRLGEALAELKNVFAVMGGAGVAKRQDPFLGRAHGYIKGAIAHQKGRSRKNALELIEKALDELEDEPQNYQDRSILRSYHVEVSVNRLRFYAWITVATRNGCWTRCIARWLSCKIIQDSLCFWRKHSHAPMSPPIPPRHINQMDMLGYPPGPFVDDGIAASRAKSRQNLKEKYDNGYAGKASAFRTSKSRLNPRCMMQ